VVAAFYLNTFTPLIPGWSCFYHFIHYGSNNFCAGKKIMLLLIILMTSAVSVQEATIRSKPQLKPVCHADMAVFIVFPPLTAVTKMVLRE
jgi:hypothetical protein